MNVSIFMPTYRRPMSLQWALASVLIQRLGGAQRASVTVLNNDVDREPVERSVRRTVDLVGRGDWEVRVVHRDPPMDPVLSWFGGIREYASDGDAVFLVGDDDIVLPDGLVARTDILEESNADVLLSRPYPGTLWFDDARDRAYLSRGAPPLSRCVKDAWTLADPRSLAATMNAFIGDQAYRLTPSFWDSFERTMAIMRSVPVSGNQQLANIPFLLPLVASIHGRVATSEMPVSIRGMRVHDASKERFAMTHWRPGVLQAITLEWMGRGELGERSDLAGLRDQTLREFAQWYLPTLTDPVARGELDRLDRLSPRQFRRSHLRSLVYGAGMVVKAATGTQHLRNRLLGWGQAHTLESFLARLRAGAAA